jgi:hypothetical protein
MLSDAIRAFRETFSPPFRRVMWLSLVVTAVTLFLFGAGLQWALAALPEFGPDLAGGWVDTILEFVARFLAVIVLIRSSRWSRGSSSKTSRRASRRRITRPIRPAATSLSGNRSSSRSASRWS